VKPIVTSDAELVVRSRQGEIEAFGTLVERYQRSVLAAALAELRDIHAAEDVAQSALLLAFRHLSTLKDGNKFGQWLMQIVRRQIVDTVRARKMPVGGPVEQTFDERAADASRWMEYEHLMDLIARLPDHERVLIGLRFFDSHSTAEMVEITGRPIGTITKQLSRAIARLRAWFQGDS
jgi:RNA polymerase sigma-70 factor (ECF subfamily)